MDWKRLELSLQRPKAFAALDGLFWADPYIADHVVYAHLDDRSSDASRPLSVIEREVDWVHAQAPRVGKLLDLGCGVGRHSLLFAQRGWSVTGIDLAEPSLEYARQEAQDAGVEARFLKGDLRVCKLPKGQDVILIAYGTLGTLSLRQARALIQRCRRALAPGGLLVFDAFRQSWFDKQLRSTKTKDWDIVAKEGFWTGAPHLVLSRTDAYPGERAFGRTYTVVESEKVRRFPLWYRWYDPEHVSEELLTGWRTRYVGGLDGKRLRQDSSWFAVVASPEE